MNCCCLRQTSSVEICEDREDVREVFENVRLVDERRRILGGEVYGSREARKLSQRLKEGLRIWRATIQATR